MRLATVRFCLSAISCKGLITFSSSSLTEYTFLAMSYFIFLLKSSYTKSSHSKYKSINPADNNLDLKFLKTPVFIVLPVEYFFVSIRDALKATKSLSRTFFVTVMFILFCITNVIRFMIQSTFYKKYFFK